uniref:Putative secreted peptide n=1 Tax=Anopheles braziliensis TaxID=58242 RepID=A0A2M3ZVJ6_9DIPT
MATSLCPLLLFPGSPRVTSRRWLYWLSFHLNNSKKKRNPFLRNSFPFWSHDAHTLRSSDIFLPAFSFSFRQFSHSRRVR